MKTRMIIFAILLFLASGRSQFMEAQGIDQPLTIQRMDNTVFAGVRSRGMGGTGLATGGNATVLFSNPALLAFVPQMDIRLSGGGQQSFYKQVQEWHPNRLYAELSLLFEDRLTGVSNNVVDTIYNTSGTIRRIDTLVLLRSYDNVKPNWSKKLQSALPNYAAVAVPITQGKIDVVGGIGYGEVMNLTYYYRNNNALRDSLNRYIGQWRPEPIQRLKPGESLTFRWFQHRIQREGSLYGVLPSVGIGIGNELKIGFSTGVITGVTNDNEYQQERGSVVVMADSTGSFNRVRVDSVSGRISQKGTSKFKGANFTWGVHFQQEYYSLGFTVQLPYKLSRTWNKTVLASTVTGDTTYHTSGKDQVSYPFVYSLGFALKPVKTVQIEFNYQVRPYANVKYEYNAQVQQPWLTTKVVRAGIEYMPTSWLTVRGGYSEDVQSFAEEGAALTNEPITGSLYSCGVGVRIQKVECNLSYEYGCTKYIDAWESNVNYNTIENHRLMVEIGYTF